MALYVDDFLAVAMRQEDFDDLHAALVELYSEVKITKENDFKFLGMSLRFIETSVEIKIDLHDILTNVVLYEIWVRFSYLVEKLHTCKHDLLDSFKGIVRKRVNKGDFLIITMILSC